MAEPPGHKAKDKNQECANQYGAVMNRLSREFNEEFCTNGGLID